MATIKPGTVRRKLIRAIQNGLQAHANKEDAPVMQAYMKSEMPNYGVKTPVMRRIVKACNGDHPLESLEDFVSTIEVLWRNAKYREERHAAIDLTRQRCYDAFQSPDLLPFYEELITTGAWWDFVDAIAPHRLGEILLAHPSVMTKKMLAWGKAKNFWQRRSAIICQIKAKEKTNVDLFFANIRESMGDQEFFLRKGIGWALREFSKTDPKAVLRFVTQHKDDLSVLSKREALRRILSKDELKRFLR